MVLSKGHFIPYPFLCVHWWIVESPPLFGYRMPYGSFIVCMFWIRWRCQPTCAICRCPSGLDIYLQKFCQRISCHIQWENSLCMRIRGDGTAPRRSVTMNGEPILWNSQIWHLGNFITHDLSNLNDITYKKVSSFLKSIDWTQDFPLFQVASKVTYYRPTAVPSMGARRGICMRNRSIN